MNYLENRKIILLMIFSLVVHIPYYFIFPLVYGWWQSWAYIAKEFGITYSEMGVMFTPLYLAYSKIVVGISINPAFSVTLGIIRTCLMTYVLYWAVKKKTNYFTGALTAAIFLFVTVSPSIYLPDDYHTAVTFAVILAYISYYEAITNNDHIIRNIILATFFSAITFYLKQNIGGLLALGITIGLTLRCLSLNKKSLIAVIYASQILSIVAIGILLGLKPINLYELTLLNEGKGSLLVLLTNFIIPTFNYKILISGLIIFYIINFLKIIILDADLYKNSIDKFTKFVEKNSILYTLFLISVTYIIFYNKKNIIEITSIVWILYLISIQLTNNKIKLLLYPSIGLMFANTLTSSFASEDMVIIILPLISYSIFEYTKIVKLRSVKLDYIFYLILVIFGFILLAGKFKNPWSWYGLAEPSISMSKTVESSLNLNLFRISPDNEKALLMINQSIREYSKSKDDTLFYPGIPYLYVLNNKKPPYNIPVYWFDVTQDIEIKKLSYNLKNKTPNLVIAMDPPNFAYLGHSQMKNKKVANYEVLETLDKLVVSNQLKLVGYMTFNNSLASADDIRAEFKLLNSDLNGLSSSKIKKKFNDMNIRINFKDNVDSVMINSKYIIDVANDDLPEFVKIYGSINKQFENHYTLKIYARK